jgi:hypothetical protein
LKRKQLKNGAKNRIIFFGEEATRTEIINRKTVLGSSLGENDGFRDDMIIIMIMMISSMIFSGTYGISGPVVSLWAIQTGQNVII